MTSVIWTIDNLKTALAGKLHKIGKHTDKQITGITIDSRQIFSGDMFIAFSGVNVDGHEFAGEALEAGAALCLLDNPAKVSDEVLENSLVVEDCYEALLAMAEYKRAHLQGKVIAITGSAGKTTTKETLKFALSKFAKASGNPGNFNNHLGMPLTLASSGEEDEYLILEMGMNSPGEIEFLSNLAKPDIAIITTIHAAHFEAFNSLQAIAEEKLSIISGMSPGGALIFDINNKFSSLAVKLAKEKQLRLLLFDNTAYKSEARALTQLKKKTANFTSADYSIEANIICMDQSPSEKLQEVDECIVNIFNSTTKLPLNKIDNTKLIVLLTCNYLGFGVSDLAYELSKITKLEGRGKPHKICLSGKNITLFDDSYNASAESMKKSLQNFASTSSGNGKKIAILTDVGELGKISGPVHYNLAVLARKLDIDKFILLGREVKITYKHLKSYKSCFYSSEMVTAELLEKLILDYCESGDIVLLKGSNYTGLNKATKKLIQKKFYKN